MIVHKDKQIKLTINKNLFFILASSISILRGAFSDFLKINNNNPKDTIPAKIVGRAIFDVYSKKEILPLVARYIFVGLPIIKNIDHVLAETNSDTKYGTGLMFALFEKKIIKGVKDYFIEHPEKLPTCNSTVEPCISKVCASNKEYELSTFIVSGYLPDKIKNEITGQDYDINSIIIAVRFNKRCDADGNITEKYTYTITK